MRDASIEGQLTLPFGSGAKGIMLTGKHGFLIKCVLIIHISPQAPSVTGNTYLLSLTVNRGLSFWAHTPCRNQSLRMLESLVANAIIAND